MFRSENIGGGLRFQLAVLRGVGDISFPDREGILRTKSGSNRETPGLGRENERDS